MAKKRPRVNLNQSVQPQKGDLEKLFSTAADVEQASGLHLLALRLEAIWPDPAQPRRTFPEEGLKDLSESIRQDGVIQPIEVTEVAPNRYMIVHGERRWRAAQLAGLETVPAVVRRRDYDHLTRFVRQLVENIQREDLNDVDRAAGLLHLRELMEQELASATAVPADEKNGDSGDRPWDHTVTWAKVGKRLGYSRQRIHQLIQLLKLPEEIKEAVRQGSLSERETRIYQGLNQMQQRTLHQVRMAGELSPSELKQVVQQLKQEPSRQIVEIIELVRLPAEPSDERVFFSTLGQPGKDVGEGTGPAIAAPPVLPAPDPGWSEKQGGGRKNALNINRVHWARDHLSRIQWHGLGEAERRELLNVLLRLQQDIATVVESLQDTESSSSL